MSQPKIKHERPRRWMLVWTGKKYVWHWSLYTDSAYERMNQRVARSVYTGKISRESIGLSQMLEPKLLTHIRAQYCKELETHPGISANGIQYEYRTKLNGLRGETSWFFGKAESLVGTLLWKVGLINEL